MPPLAPVSWLSSCARPPSSAARARRRRAPRRPPPHRCPTAPSGPGRAPAGSPARARRPLARPGRERPPACRRCTRAAAAGGAGISLSVGTTSTAKSASRSARARSSSASALGVESLRSLASKTIRRGAAARTRVDRHDHVSRPPPALLEVADGFGHVALSQRAGVERRRHALRRWPLASRSRSASTASSRSLSSRSS